MEFDNFLLSVSSITWSATPNDLFSECIALPQYLMEQGECLELIFLVTLRLEDLASRVILTPRHDESLKMNNLVLNRHLVKFKLL